MSSSPRKFSEKIALLNQKQAEQNAAFMSIISEVKSIRPSQPNVVHQNTLVNPSNSFGNNSQAFQAINQNSNINKDISDDVITDSSSHFLQSGFSIKENNSNNNQRILNNNDSLNYSCDYTMNIKPFILNNKNMPQKTNNLEQNVNNTTFLQLPSQSDSFRRAHSDSSLHQSSAGNMNNSSLNQTNNQNFHHAIKLHPNENFNNNCYNNLEQPNSPLSHGNQSQFVGFHLGYQDTHSLPLNSYENFQNMAYSTQNQADSLSKTSNSLMPHSPMNMPQNTFASLPDLSTFNYNNAESFIQDNNLISNSNQHNLTGALKPTHYSTSPTRITTRYSPTHSNRRLSPQRSDKYPSPIQNLQNLNLRNNYGIQNTNMVPNNMYRNNSNPNESLPPSPQSQQSCFNSPQGSPGPHSISPQDLNPFSCNNYESMQKKFDLFNLEASHSPYNSFNSQKAAITKNSTGLTVTSSQNSNVIESTNIDNSTNNQSNNNLSNPNLADNINNFNKQLIKANSQGLQHSNNNRGNDLIDNTDIRSNYSNNITNCDNSNMSMNSTPMYCATNINSNCTPHKNSIPDIILTFSDSTEDKTDFVKVLSSDLYNECNTKPDDSLDFESLQIFGESVEQQDELELDNLNQQIL